MDKWDNRFIALAQHIAEWSKDPSTKVGAVIVDEKNRVISIGYNGVPRGVNEPISGDRESKLLRTIHAEENALAFAYRDVEGCRMYVSFPPCAHCAAQIIQRGIKEVVYRSDAPGIREFFDRWSDNIREAWAMFDEAKVEARSMQRYDDGC